MRFAIIGLAWLSMIGVGIAQTPVPRGPDGKPDFSGVWQSLSGADYGLEPHLATKDEPPGAGVVEGNAIPYQPWALEQRAKNFAAGDSRPAAQMLHAGDSSGSLRQ